MAILEITDVCTRMFDSGRTRRPGGRRSTSVRRCARRRVRLAVAVRSPTPTSARNGVRRRAARDCSQRCVRAALIHYSSLPLLVHSYSCNCHMQNLLCAEFVCSECEIVLFRVKIIFVRYSVLSSQ